PSLHDALPISGVRASRACSWSQNLDAQTHRRTGENSNEGAGSPAPSTRFAAVSSVRLAWRVLLRCFLSTVVFGPAGGRQYDPMANGLDLEYFHLDGLTP